MRYWDYCKVFANNRHCSSPFGNYQRLFITTCGYSLFPIQVFLTSHLEGTHVLKEGGEISISFMQSWLRISSGNSTKVTAPQRHSTAYPVFLLILAGGGRNSDQSGLRRVGHSYTAQINCRCTVLFGQQQATPLLLTLSVAPIIMHTSHYTAHNRGTCLFPCPVFSSSRNTLFRCVFTGRG